MKVWFFTQISHLTQLLFSSLQALDRHNQWAHVKCLSLSRCDWMTSLQTRLFLRPASLWLDGRLSAHVSPCGELLGRHREVCWEMQCEPRLDAERSLVKELQLPWQEQKGAETLERLKRKLSIWFSGGFNAVAVNYRYDWRNVSILFYLRFNVAKTTSYLVV